MKDLRVFLILVFFVLMFSIISNYAFAIPLWSDNTTNITSGSAYTSGRVYDFGMNWTNTTNGWGVIDNVTFETNMTTGTTTLENITKANTANYTTFTNSTGIWNISFTQEQLAGAGTYVFKWYANDTAGNWNSTAQWIYSISQASQEIILELNGTKADKTYTRGQIANISAVSNATGDNITASFTIFSNFTGANASLVNVSGGVLNSVYNLTNTANLATGKYLIFANISETENYTTATNNSLILTVETIGDGSSCTASIECTNGYCVHSICRSSSTYCGDSYCDSGESCSSCSADCGTCPYVPPPGMPSPTLVTTPGKAVIYIPSIAAAAKANVTIQKTEGIDFMEISITVENKVNSVYLTITKLDAKPTETPALVNVYRYVRVVEENIQDEDISEAKIKFKVNKTWISDNNIDEDTVALQRYTTSWNKLTTTKLSEDTEFVYYEAETLGFSYFAITGEEEVVPVGPVCGNNICETGEDYTNCPADCPAPCVEDWTCTAWSVCVNNTQTRTCTDENNCGTTVNKPLEEQTCEVTPPIQDNLLIMILVMIIIIGILIGKFKLKRKTKAK